MKNYQTTQWLHKFMEEQVQAGDLCIDATMGNGNDTAFLSALVGNDGRVLAFDIQEEALVHTKNKLREKGCPDNVQLLLESHERMGDYAEAESVSCIVFNFGYLPGGDHKKATKAASSLRAVEAGLGLLKKGGLMTLCIYSGGDSGFEEKEALLQYIRTLPAGEFLVLETRYANRSGNPPIPVLIIRL